MELRHENGVTLVELIITVTVLAMLASFAVPGFSNVLQNNAMTASANELVTGFMLARSEALKRRSPVTICWTDSAGADDPACGSGDGWHAGWLIFADDDGDATFDAGEAIVRRQSGLPGRHVTVQVRSISAPLDTALTYLPAGFPDFAGTLPSARNLLLCDRRADDDFSRVINISQTGRPQVRERRDFSELEMSCES